MDWCPSLQLQQLPLIWVGFGGSIELFARKYISKKIFLRPGIDVRWEDLALSVCSSSVHRCLALNPWSLWASQVLPYQEWAILAYNLFGNCLGEAHFSSSNLFHKTGFIKNIAGIHMEERNWLTENILCSAIKHLWVELGERIPSKTLANISIWL